MMGFSNLANICGVSAQYKGLCLTLCGDTEMNTSYSRPVESSPSISGDRHILEQL